jgi:RNA polymerase sigma-B factor
MAVTRASVTATGSSELFRRWHDARDIQARDALIERFLPLARKLARRYAGSSEPYDDLLQVASLGLVKAVERFDPSRGFAFSSFAVPTILGELKRYFRDSAWALQTGEAFDTVSLDAPRSSESATARRLDALGGQDDRLVLVDDQTTVFAAAQRLPERERRILYLRYGEDLTQAEIAVRIGVSQMQVSRLLRKSVNRLRELIEDRQPRAG